MPIRSCLSTVALALVVGCSSAGAPVAVSNVSDAGRGTVDLAGTPTAGPATAKVVVVEFGDFECPYCGQEEPVVKQMLTDYAGQILFAFKEFPLASIHPYAELAAEAALAANAQGKFWPYHDLLYANQAALGRTALDSYATMLGLDLTTFDGALDGGTYASAVAADEALGVKLGVNATPTFFVNGAVVVGAVPYAALKAAVDAALAAP